MFVPLESEIKGALANLRTNFAYYAFEFKKLMLSQGRVLGARNLSLQGNFVFKILICNYCSSILLD